MMKKKQFFSVLLGICLWMPFAAQAKDFTISALILSETLKKGSHYSSANNQKTDFYFVSVTENKTTKKKAALLHWAPIAHDSPQYRNGALIDIGTVYKFWFNGTWHTVSFDGKTLRIE